MMGAENRAAQFAAAAVAVWLLYAAIWAPLGVYSTDGYIGLQMIEAMATEGTFFLDNGYLESRSPALVMKLTEATEAGLAPLYPGLWGVIAAPAWWLAEARGVLVFNALAGGTVVWLTWATAMRAFGDRRLAGEAALLLAVATFLFDYAAGFWTHAPATAFVALGIYAIVRAFDEDEAALWALISGAAFGAAINIRVDAVMPLAGVLIWPFLTWARAYRGAALIALGAAPGFLAAATVNWVKFDVFSPLSYGVGGGPASAAYYADLIPFLVLGAAGCAAIGLLPVRRAVLTPIGLGLAAATALAALALLPQAQALAARLLVGAHGLILDFNAYQGPGAGLARDEDGRLIAFGQVKRALLQSAPFLIAGVAAMRGFRRSGDGPAAALFALVALAAMGPFLFAAWFGGMANSMRYFLHAMPALVLLACLGLQGVSEGGRSPVALAAAIGAAAALAINLSPTHPDDIFGGWWSFRLSEAALLISAAVFAAAALLGRRTPRAIRSLAAPAFALSVFAGAVAGPGLDLRVSRAVGSWHEAFSQLAATLPSPALVGAYTPGYLNYSLNQGARDVMVLPFNTAVLPEAVSGLIQTLLAAGEPVFVQGEAAANSLTGEGVVASDPLFGVDPVFDFYRLSSSAAPRS